MSFELAANALIMTVGFTLSALCLAWAIPKVSPRLPVGYGEATHMTGERIEIDCENGFCEIRVGKEEDGGYEVQSSYTIKLQEFRQ